MQYVIISIIVAFGIFLICRELMCWYFKINIIVELLEKQNELLRQQMGNSSVSIISDFTPSHKVKLFTNAEGLGLRKNPDPSSDSFIKLPDGTEVQHLNTGSEIILHDKKGFWYEIITKDRIKGWCFSGSLEKICGRDLPNFEINESYKSNASDLSNCKVIVTNKTNIRKGPGEDQLQLGVMQKNEIINIIRTENNWSCFIQDNGHEGWIHSSFLKIIE